MGKADASQETPGERLAKVLSQAGVASRRKAEELIRSGVVRVNGLIVTEPQRRVDLLRDIITCNNKKITQKTKVYLALHKPRGYISDLEDPRGRKLARDLVKIPGRLFPVGRLDYDSEGLLLFTNDGEFANTVMHPRFGVTKQYEVKFRGLLERSNMELIKKGVVIDGVVYRVVDIILELLSVSGNAWYRIVAEEGRNRLIRKLGDYIDHPVLRLRRLRIGTIDLGKLEPGEYRTLSRREIESIERCGRLKGAKKEEEIE